MDNIPMEDRIVNIERMLTEIHTLLVEFKPMLDKYKRVSQSTNWRQARKEIKTS